MKTIQFVAIGLLMNVTLSAPVCDDSEAATIRIGFYVGEGASRNPHGNSTSLDIFYTVITSAADAAFQKHYTIHNLTGPDVAGVSPDNYDVIIFPGGSGSGQANATGAAGLEAMRRFVAAGKG